MDQQIRRVLHARDRGEATDRDVTRAEDAVTSIVVAEQSRAFIDIVTDGLVRWEGPLSHLAHHLDGVEAGDLVRWFDTNFYDRRPEILSAVRRPGPFLVHGYEVAAAVGAKPVKVVLPGPVTFARLARDRHYNDLAALAEDLAVALAAEVSDLVSAGARYFQIDEPLLCRHPEDLDLVAATAAEVFRAAGENACTILSTYFGTLGPLGDRIDRLPGTHLGLDWVGHVDNERLLGRLPADKGVVLGLFDARTTRLEDVDELARRLEPHAPLLTRRDVQVGPQAGLELLPRDQAFDKLLHARYLVETLTREWTWHC